LRPVVVGREPKRREMRMTKSGKKKLIGTEAKEKKNQKNMLWKTKSLRGGH